jgi:hypothetical protein
MGISRCGWRMDGAYQANPPFPVSWRDHSTRVPVNLVRRRDCLRRQRPGKPVSSRVAVVSSSVRRTVPSRRTPL